jgi:hypothetical protein
VSQAAIRSNRGDDFQREIVLQWAIRLLSDNDLASVESETIADPVTQQVILVDDVIIRWKNGNTAYGQCKIDSTDRNGWKLSDKVLGAELIKARDQLEQDPLAEALFYSQTPFGELKKLLDAVSPYHSAATLLAHGDSNIKELHAKFSTILQRDDNATFSLYKRIKAFANDLDQWAYFNNTDLARHLPNPLAARDAFLSLITDHAAQRTGSPLRITRETLVNRLIERRIFLSQSFDERVLREEFALASRIGRQDIPREIAGEKLPRPELAQLIERATLDGTTIVKGPPGNGKSWLLLEFADQVESNPCLSLLFIKGDRFSTIESEKELSAALHLSGTLSGMVERLAEKRRVVLVFDSLDTLSLSGNHPGIQTYLSILDRLDQRTNISIICACRTFDLAYDPLLRERKWACQITLAPLDPETVVRPFLRRLGIDCTIIPEETIKLFGNPQYLKLYEAIHQKVSLSEVRSIQMLQERFLREKVEKDPQLGESALQPLYALAELLAKKRSLRCERSDVATPESIVRHLQSAEVLSGDQQTIGFTHQTFFDALWVRSARQRGMGLGEFVLTRPALPFYRPAIRAYVQYLHETDPTLFVREAVQLFSDSAVAYHVRKLALDTLAEMSANESDIALCRWLIGHDADLFRRFLWATKDESWFRLFRDHHLIEDGLFGDTTPERQRQWLAWVGRKESNYSREKIAVWRKFLTSADEEVHRQIMMNANDFNEWLPEDQDIVETLVSWDAKGRLEHLLSGKIIRLFVEATNQGDDLLWGFLRQQIMSSKDFPHPYRRPSSLDLHALGDKDFLATRLGTSEPLLTSALDSLLEWTELCRDRQDWNHTYLTLYLSTTSWELRHTDYDLRSHDGFKQLFTGIEQAIKKHAVLRTGLWLEYGPKLLACREQGLMYLAIRGIQSGPERNAGLVESFLTEHHPSLLYGNQLTHEFWELVHDTAPYLSAEVLNAIQAAALEKVIEAETKERPWMKGQIYHLLARIPSCYLQEETLQFMRSSAKRHGPPSFEPNIVARGGWVPPPISRDVFIGLSLPTQLKLLRFINRDWSSDSHFSSSYKDMATIVCEAASADPTRYLGLRDMLAGDRIEPAYEAAIIEGCANQLRYRYGNLQPPNGWKPFSEPDALDLARTVLHFCEAHTENTIEFARNVEACCTLLHAQEDVTRLIPLLSRVLGEQPPENSNNDIGFQALNSALGIAASGACQLYLTLNKHDCPIPDELTALLFQAAKSSYDPARWALLRWLPFMLSHDEELCWSLFQACHADHPDDLWNASHDFVYYTYWKHPERHLPYLERMSLQEKDEVRRSYGTLLALYFLSRKIKPDLFWERVTGGDAFVLSGIAGVFVKNIDEPDCRTLCLDGVQWLLDQADLSTEAKNEIDLLFSKLDRPLPGSVALKFIELINADEDRLYWFMDWLGVQSKYDPEKVLEIIEALLRRQRQIGRNYFWHAEGLVAAAINILRHADLLGDEALIGRAIAVQDELIRLGVGEMEKALEEAARI